jgi:RNA polymerase sigma-70 factor, ECF subfamily
MNLTVRGIVTTPVDPATRDAPTGGSSPVPTRDEALRIAYETHGPILLNYLLRLSMGNRAMAEDILQETLVRAWNHPQARGEDGQWSRAWLFTVARRIAIDHVRSSQGRPTERLDDHVEDRHAAADGTDQLLNNREVRAAVARLPERLRSALVEIYFQEHSVAEAARNLSVPEGTVKSRTFYALRALHEDLTSRGFTL